MKAYGSVVPLILYLSTRWLCLASTPVVLLLWKISRCPQVGGREIPKAGLEALEHRKFMFPYRASKLSSRYSSTNCAILLPIELDETKCVFLYLKV
jgi:hypothetical protein